MNNNNDTSEDIYIEILAYLKDFFTKRKLIFTCLLIALIASIISIIASPRFYSSKVTFIVQGSTGAKSSGGINGLVGLLSGGGDNSNSSADLPTFLYPKIIESLYFKRKLSNTKLKLRGVDSIMTFKDYALTIEKPSLGSSVAKYTIGLPSLLFKKKVKPTAIKTIDSLNYVTSSEKEMFLSMEDKISFAISDDDGTLEIKTKFDNQPIAAAQLAENAMLILQNEIIRYRIAKAKEKYEFINKQYEDKKGLFEESQRRLANYTDRNLFNATNSSLIRKQQLQDESLLLYTIFSDLEQQRLSQSIKIQEDTPTFTVIHPAIVPTVADSKNSLVTLALYLFAGFLIAAFLYAFRKLSKYFKSLWNEV